MIAVTLWAVTIDTALLEPVTDDQIGGLVDIMSAREAAVSVGDGRISCTIAVPADDAMKAAARADKTWRLELDSQQIVAGDNVALEVMTVDEQDRRLEQPILPEIWGTVEVADELGVSRQRVHQLVAEHSRFPEPLVRLGAGPLWLADTIRAFNATWERKPGRPRAVPPADSPAEAKAVRVSPRQAAATRKERRERLASQKAATAARKAATASRRVGRKAAASRRVGKKG